MQAPEWSRVWDLFEETLQRGPEQREAFLDKECTGETTLRQEVASLVESHDRAGAFLEQAVSGAAATALSEIAQTAVAGDWAPGRRIGPWEIVREVGRGGMGFVFLAERADGQYRRRAAVKLLRTGLNGDEPLRRFLAERRILAALDHPNIARLLDGGADDDGAPYVVMEYVEGEPIDTYCDRRRLAVADRLRLFGSVCGAVLYAHRSLVVHRDIKPANILVTTDGVPKLLDFGIAKLLDPAAAEPETRAELRLLTPEYASPEQVRGEPITTASDVYSLGVLLYWLLAGRLPYRLRTRAPREIERAITETDPDRPSAALRREDADPAGASEVGGSSSLEIAAARGTSPEKLARLLAGDLDNIVMMALRKEPGRRYGSVEALSEDVRNHLAARPVSAHAPTLAYRARKFVRRHPLGTLAAAAFALLLAAFISVVSAQSSRVAAERDRALAAEVRARTEASAAQQTAAFLVDLFKIADPKESRGREVTAREMLDLGAARLPAGLKEQPVVRARLLGTIGEVYSNLGAFEEAEHQAREALAVNRSAYGEEHPEVARSLAVLGAIHAIRGDHAAADEALVAALEMRRRLLVPSHADIAESLNRLGNLRQTQGRQEEAESLLREALAISRQASGARDPKTATILRNLGHTLARRGKLPEAETLLRESLAIREDVLGEDHPDVSLSLGSLGDVLRQQSRYEEAERVHQRELSLTRRVFGPDHPNTATACTDLSAVLKEKGDLVEAEALAREALDIHRKAFGEAHDQVAQSLNNLANLRQDQGDLDGAIELHRRAISVVRRIFGDEHPRLGDCLNNLANVLWEKGNYAAAEEAYREALALDRKLLGEEHPYVAMDLNNLALVLRDRGDLEDAKPLVQEALDIQTRAEGRDGATTALYIGSLGALYLKMQHVADAERLVGESLRILEAKLPADHWRIHAHRVMLAECLAAGGDFEGAEALMIPSVEALTRTLGTRSGYTRRARESTAAIYEKMGRPEKAAAYRSSR